MAATPGSISASASAPHAGSIARDGVLLAFCGLAFGWSWGLWLVALLAGGGPVTGLADQAALFGPLVAAVVVAWRSGQLRGWATGVLRWRVAGRWWALALGLPLVWSAAVHAAALLAGVDALDGSLLPSRAAAYLPVLLVTTVVMGGFNEEPGWRGLALPRLQQHRSPLQATLLLGAVWALWHVPQVLLAADGSGLSGAQTAATLAATAIEVVGWTVVFTWLFNRTASTLLCIVLHGGINAAALSLLLRPEATAASTAVLVGLLGAAVVAAGAVVLVAATRARLGFET